MDKVLKLGLRKDATTYVLTLFFLPTNKVVIFIVVISVVLFLCLEISVLQDSEGSAPLSIQDLLLL